MWVAQRFCFRVAHSQPSLPACSSLPSKLCVMSAPASASNVLPGASPRLDLDLADLLVLGGEVGVSPSGVGEGASPSAGAGDAGAAPCVKDEEVLEESPAKRPRTESPGCFAHASPKHEDANPETASPPHAPGRSGRKVKGQRPNNSDDPKICGGFFRQYGVSPCFVNRDEIVSWALQGGRGFWCADCYSIPGGCRR